MCRMQEGSAAYASYSGTRFPVFRGLRVRMGIHSGVAEEVSSNMVTERRTYGGEVTHSPTIVRMFHKYTGHTGDTAIYWSCTPFDALRCSTPCMHVQVHRCAHHLAIRVWQVLPRVMDAVIRQLITPHHVLHHNIINPITLPWHIARLNS